MDHLKRIADVSGHPSMDEVRRFTAEILGKPVPTTSATAQSSRERRAQLEWLALVSPKHADELRKLKSAEDKARRDRELLVWAAGISHEAESKLRKVLREEADAREAQAQWDGYSTSIEEWNEADHPRQPKGTSTGGEWAPKGGGGAGGQAAGTGGQAKTSGKAAQGVASTTVSQSDPSRWYLPSDAKGQWVGAKGDSAFRLHTPIKANGEIVREIEFTKGVPVLDKYALPGNTATIILTGDHKTDLYHAEQAWRKLNPGKNLPPNSTFHHDLLHATEQTVTINGKKTKVLVGKMQLVPKDVNKAVFHEGTASVAKKYYRALGADISAVARLAKEDARLAGNSLTIVSRALPKIKPGKIAKGIAPLVGRSIVRAIPIIGSGLAIFEFADNAEAHGIGGAVARATPVLGELISAHDLGSDLAKQIRDEADAAARHGLSELNKPSREAWEQADAQTIAAFQELAPQIQVTNVPESEDGGRLVDADEIAAALRAYREDMQGANLSRNSRIKGFDYNAAAAYHKQQLRKRLERASQKNRPAQRGPMA
jgi:hypothetical protein